MRAFHGDGSIGERAPVWRRADARDFLMMAHDGMACEAVSKNMREKDPS